MTRADDEIARELAKSHPAGAARPLARKADVRLIYMRSNFRYQRHLKDHILISIKSSPGDKDYLRSWCGGLMASRRYLNVSHKPTNSICKNCERVLAAWERKT